MIKLNRLIVGVTSLAAAAVLVAGTVTTATAAPAAPHDPPSGVTPAAYDIVGVGSNTTEYVMDQLTGQYDATVKTHNPGHPKIYSWDALPKGDNVEPTPAPTIKPKAGCATIDRPDGSSAGITAIDSTQVIKYKGASYRCLNFARSSRARKTSDPKAAPGGLAFVTFARDAITWAVRTPAKGGNDAPKSLTLAQLKKIFTCADTNWDEVGGKDAPITVYLPQAGSGTLSTWESFMDITTLGSCVNQAPEENEGTYHGFNSPNAIWIWSIGAYVSQKYHSANCNAKPTKNQNAFGCNLTGYNAPMPISGVSPFSSGKVPTINPKFPSDFWRTLYNVVPYAATASKMPGNLTPIFGRTGYLCTNAKAKTEIRDYGFVTTGLCGSIS
jgi:ABC-type phosphate transport system substrate-binding protein